MLLLQMKPSTMGYSMKYSSSPSKVTGEMLSLVLRILAKANKQIHYIKYYCFFKRLRSSTDWALQVCLSRTSLIRYLTPVKKHLQSLHGTHLQAFAELGTLRSSHPVHPEVHPV